MRKVKYNNGKINGEDEASLVTYETKYYDSKSYSNFSIDEKDVKRISPELVNNEGEMIELPDAKFKELIDCYMKNTYNKIKFIKKDGKEKEVNINKEATRDQVDKIIQAFNGEFLYIEKEVGEEDLPTEDESLNGAVRSRDGLCGLFEVGTTNGSKNADFFIQIEVSNNEEDVNSGIIMSTNGIKKMNVVGLEKGKKMVENYNNRPETKESPAKTTSVTPKNNR